MRIGIITLPLHTNYGGILQAYALQTVLERMGHDAYLIEKRTKPLNLPIWKMPFSYGKRVIKKLTGDNFPIFYEQKKNREIPIIRQHTDRFINKYIKREIVNDFTDIKESDFNIFIVGSDQIWRPKYFDKIEHAYLDFTIGWNVKRIAYAASFGTDEWEYSSQQTMLCSELVKLFNAVSVREKSGAELCSKYLGINATHVLDPTMLLSKKDYIHLFEASYTPKSDGLLFAYILDITEEKSDLVNKFILKMGLNAFHANSEVNNLGLPLNERIQPPLERWLRGFYDADFVVTDSFHACVFSIIFHVPFVAIGNKERGMSRFQSLLSLVNLEERLLDENATVDDIQSLKDIDWDKVDELLQKQREISMSFLSQIKS